MRPEAIGNRKVMADSSPLEAMSARELDQLSLFLEIGLYFSTQESDCAARDGVAR